MKRILLTLLAFLCCSNALAAEAPTQFDFYHFSLLPVLHEGRIKPLDSFARIKLREFSGDEEIEGRRAMQWLAETLFDPSEAAELPVFEINDSELKTYLGLSKKQKRFTLADLKKSFDENKKAIETLAASPPEKLTPPQRNVLDVYHKATSYMELLRSFSAVLPLNIEVPQGYPKGNTYLDLYASETKARHKIEELTEAKGPDLDTYTDQEKSLAAFAFALDEVREGGADNTAFKIIPVNDEWVSPWQLLQQGDDTDTLKMWQDIASAYRAGDATKWDTATEKLFEEQPSKTLLWLEKLYNFAKPFRLALGFYFLGLVIIGSEISSRKMRPLFPIVCLSFGIASHVAGIAMRMTLLQRPPVGTLYESILFVSLICALAALIGAARNKSFTMLASGMAAAMGLLFISPFLLQQGESMEMLVAVLNTNFWLATHVLCITAGYGISILTACLAHGWFIMRLRGAGMDKLMPLQNGIYKISLIALLLTAVGTILGGIWADQSWGRFWGWDPKENGALLIVLWIIWMQHGRVAAQLKTMAFMASAAFLNVVVALAWFGVNLLSVGLHSYGFISGIALALGLFCAAEIITIATLWVLNVKNSGKNKEDQIAAA